MGYRIHCNSSESKFKIPEAKCEAAVAILLKARGNYTTVENAVEKIKHFKRLPASVQLVEIVRHVWGFTLDIPDEEDGGDITGIGFEWEKGTGAEDGLFQILGPYVEAGSVVLMYGEGGEQWRYAFDGTACKMQTPKIEWVDQPWPK